MADLDGSRFRTLNLAGFGGMALQKLALIPNLFREPIKKNKAGTH